MWQAFKINGPVHIIRSNISSTESNVNIHLLVAWNTIDRQSIILKSKLSDENKRDLFQVVPVFILLNGCTTWILTKPREKAWWELHKNATCCLDRILEATPFKTAAVRPPVSHYTNHSSKTDKTRGTLYEKQGRSHTRRFSYEVLHMDVPVLADHQRHTSVWT